RRAMLSSRNLFGALCRLLPEHERVVIIEETRELHAIRTHAISLAARAANAEGMGAVSLDDLTKTALRMRPDRIVIGEVRGAEAWTALRAATTGHAGSMLTVHARAATQALETLSFLALAGAPGFTQEELIGAFERAVDAVVHLERRGPARRVAEMRRLA
ncbi:MAG TPA: ATPase, T2SS/T4P/T4SS family, partial [Vicinamibacterales bacterium]|nr:ATPase, T2SS/T4P/T4SS family [Vicinamibacterales bacterium]